MLESDALRKIFTPHPRYDEAEREVFYEQVAYLGALLVRHGIVVIFDATANRRAYRDKARQADLAVSRSVRGHTARSLHGARPEKHLSSCR